MVVWRERQDDPGCRNRFAGRPAGHRAENGQLTAQFVDHDGRRRLIAMTRIAWALHRQEWPDQPVVFIDRQDDYRASNLTLGVNPRCSGGRRVDPLADQHLMAAMLRTPDASTRVLAKLTGGAQPCVARRLQKFAAQGLAIAPKCTAGRSWFLTAAGQAPAEEAELLECGVPTNGHAVKWIKPLFASQSRDVIERASREVPTKTIRSRITRQVQERKHRFGKWDRAVYSRTAAE